MLTLLAGAASGVEPDGSGELRSDDVPRDTPTGTTTVRFVVDVPAATRSATLDALGAVFGMTAVRDAIEPFGEEPDADDAARIARADLAIALGRDACASAARLRGPHTIVICTLLYRHAWRDIRCPSGCENLVALLLDQPLVRQVDVARAAYPALRRFGVLSAEAMSNGDDAITVRRPSDGGDLALAFEELARENDALVAVAEPSLYDADTLRIALLSAYGRGRPVIGFGPEYVRAGALLGVWSTPRDALDQVSDLLGDGALWAAYSSGREAARARLRSRFGESRTLSPDRFHIERNTVVARSLGLSEGVGLPPGGRLTDADIGR